MAMIFMDGALSTCDEIFIGFLSGTIAVLIAKHNRFSDGPEGASTAAGRRPPRASAEGRSGLTRKRLRRYAHLSEFRSDVISVISAESG
jgi:hypothetical protein